MALERDFQRKLIKEIKNKLPGCYILKNDPNYIQGIPDLMVLNGSKWAALEVKKSAGSPHRPNQDHYVAQMNADSFAAFVYPENKDFIVDSLVGYLGSDDSDDKKEMKE